jgi:hypothetical protein
MICCCVLMHMLQAPNGLQANSRHVLQESTSHNTTELEKAGVPEVAAVSPSLPEGEAISDVIVYMSFAGVHGPH